MTLLSTPQALQQPQIILTLVPQGPTGQLGVNVSLVEIPGGWETALKVLGTAVQLCAEQLAHQLQSQRVVLAQTVPALTG